MIAMVLWLLLIGIYVYEAVQWLMRKRTCSQCGGAGGFASFDGEVTEFDHCPWCEGEGRRSRAAEIADSVR